jgi:hypothetical protein
MFLFTDFIGDVEFRYQLGYWFIGYVSLVFLLNFSIIVADMFTDLHHKRKQKVFNDKWKAFNKKEDEILEFIIRDYRQKCPEDKRSHNRIKNIFRTQHSFERLCDKVEKIIRLRNEP